LRWPKSPLLTPVPDSTAMNRGKNLIEVFPIKELPANVSTKYQLVIEKWKKEKSKLAKLDNIVEDLKMNQHARENILKDYRDKISKLGNQLHDLTGDLEQSEILNEREKKHLELERTRKLMSLQEDEIRVSNRNIQSFFENFFNGDEQTNRTPQKLLLVGESKVGKTLFISNTLPLSKFNRNHDNFIQKDESDNMYTYDN
jgi:hypothetical protein